MAQKPIEIPPSLERLLVERALGPEAAAKAEDGYLSHRELADVANAMLELSDKFNDPDSSQRALGHYMKSKWQRAAYLLYFLPANFAKLRAVAQESAPAFAGREELSVLDVGAGPGSLSLGLMDYLARETGIRRLRLMAVDSSREALGDWRFLVDGYRKALSAEGMAINIVTETAVTNVAMSPAPKGPWDLVMMGDTLNELFRGTAAPALERARVISRYAAHLSATGGVIVLEPALRALSRALHEVRDSLVKDFGLAIHAPCLHQGPCPMLAPGKERDWCHVGVNWQRPNIVRRIDKITERNKFALKFAYLVVRNAETKATGAAGVGTGAAGVGTGAAGAGTGAAGAGATLFRVAGEVLTEKGKCHVLLCGENVCRTFTLLTRDESPANAALTTVERGDVVSLDSWVDKKDGARLTKESSVTICRRLS